MISQRPHQLISILVLILASLSFSSSLVAQGDVTATLPPALSKALQEAPIKDLPPQLVPLTKDQLAELSQSLYENLQIASRKRVNAELAMKNEVEGASQENIDAALEEERLLVQRLEAVTSAWKKKGGDPQEIEAYVDSVSGVDGTDLSNLPQLWQRIKNWFLDANGGLALLLNILKFIGILIVARIVARLAQRVARKAVSKIDGFSTLLKNFIVRTVGGVIRMIGLVIALAAVGIPVSPLVAALGAAGLVIGLALQGTLSNFAAGILILIYRPYDIGNFIEAGGAKGTVTRMNIFSTILRTPDGQIVMIPNGSIWSGTITNATGVLERRVDMVFGIGYSDDIDKAKGLLQKIIADDDRVLSEPAPTIEVSELADSSVNFIVRPWVKTANYWGVKFGVTEEVKKRFDAEGISIPFPQRDVHVFQPEGE